MTTPSPAIQAAKDIEGSCMGMKWDGNGYTGEGDWADSAINKFNRL